jgi:hypothetical protein
MTIVFLVIALAFSAVVVFFTAVRSRTKHAAIQPLDVAAMRALIDREDELFLKKSLAARSFRQLKRQRIRVTVKYVDRVAANSAAVLRLSEAGRLSDDPEVAQTSARVADLATQIRAQCWLAYAKLGVEFAFPQFQLTPAVLVPQYQSLRENVMRLGALQPQYAVQSAPAL